MLLAPMIAAIQPADASSFALLGPAFARTRADSAVARAVVARARAALARPPAPIPRLHTEGTLPGKGIRDISIAAKRDHAVMLDLALAWRLTGERVFLDQTARYLDAWTRTYQMSFNPIDETGFDQMLMAYDLVKADLSIPARVPIDGFWRQMSAGYLDRMDAGRTGHDITNWQSHRVKLATMAAFEVGDRPLIARARAAFRKQAAVNLRADGSTFDFEERDALHYVTYDLDPLLMAALSAKVHGEDWFGWSAPGGASLPRSLDWLARFADGTRTHVEFVHSKIAFDRDRANAGDAEYGPHLWQPESAADTFAIAALCDPRFAPLAAKLAGGKKRIPAWIELL